MASIQGIAAETLKIVIIVIEPLVSPHECDLGACARCPSHLLQHVDDLGLAHAPLDGAPLDGPDNHSLDLLGDVRFDQRYTIEALLR